MGGERFCFRSKKSFLLKQTWVEQIRQIRRLSGSNTDLRSEVPGSVLNEFVSPTDNCAKLSFTLFRLCSLRESEGLEPWSRDIQASISTTPTMAPE